MNFIFKNTKKLDYSSKAQLLLLSYYEARSIKLLTESAWCPVFSPCTTNVFNLLIAVFSLLKAHNCAASYHPSSRLSLVHATNASQRVLCVCVCVCV